MPESIKPQEIDATISMMKKLLSAMATVLDGEDNFMITSAALMGTCASSYLSMMDSMADLDGKRAMARAITKHLATIQRDVDAMITNDGLDRTLENFNATVAH